MVRFNSAGRVQPIAFKHMASPATCVLCSRIGKDQEEYFADLRVELEYYGCVYMCVDCCAELADFIGFISNDVHKVVVDLLEQARMQEATALLKYSNVKEMLDARVNDVSSLSDVHRGDESPDLSVSQVRQVAAGNGSRPPKF